MKISNDDNISNEPIIKEEDAFHATQNKQKEKNKKLNPPTKQGKVSRCAICDSKMHWAKNCEHKRPENAKIAETSKEETDSEYEVDDVNFVLITTQTQKKILLRKW